MNKAGEAFTTRLRTQVFATLVRREMAFFDENATGNLCMLLSTKVPNLMIHLYIYIYVYTHVCISLSIYICIYVYIDIHTSTHIYIYIYLSLSIYIYI